MAGTTGGLRTSVGALHVCVVAAASTLMALGGMCLCIGNDEAAAASPVTADAVSITSWPDGLFGYVTGDQKNAHCGADTVALMEQVGSTQDAAADTKVATVTPSETTSGDRWLVRSKASGKFYALLHSKSCASTASSTIASESKNDIIPKCPSTEQVCSFQLSFDTNAPCPNFGASFGMCIGTSFGSSVPWTVPVLSIPALFATLQWSGSSSKSVLISGTNGGPVSGLIGSVPVSHSPNYSVQDAFAAKWTNPGIRFYTPDIPGVIAGQMGGPLWLNFVNGYVGVTVHLHGFLYRRN